MDFSFFSFAPLLLIAASIPPVYASLVKTQPNNRTLMALTASIVGPFFLGLTLYILFYLVPHQPNYFYLLTLVLVLLIFYISFGKRSWLFVDFIKAVFTRGRRLKLSSMSKLLLILGLTIIALIIIRMIFWPINWDDQIFYIEQSYAFAHLKSLNTFFSWGFFRDSQVFHQMDPAIRPGLPMLYSLSFLASSSLQSGQIFAQIVIFYFFSIFCLVVGYLATTTVKGRSVETGLLAVFLMLSTYIFTNHIISGFKEFIIIGCLLLVLANLDRNRAVRFFSPANLSSILLLGVMPFIGLFGSLVVIILLAITLVVVQRAWSEKILDIIQSIVAITLLSGLEFSYLFYWTIREIIISRIVTLPAVAPETNLVGTTASAANELQGYNIISKTDLFVKGKLQGFFQLEYYGLIFWTFLGSLVFRFQALVNNGFTRLLLFFLLIYLLLVIDPIGWNHHPYAYVLEVSHKYSVTLVPLLALIIASQLKLFLRIFERLKPMTWIGLAVIYIATYYFLIRSHYPVIMGIVDKIIPIHQNPDYYLKLVREASLAICILAMTLVVAIGGVWLTAQRQFLVIWSKYSVSFVLALVGLFLIPFSFFFNTNYGFKETLGSSTKSKSEKLLLIKGWQDLYEPIATLNELPKNSRILFAGKSIGLLELHTNFNTLLVDDATEYFARNHLSIARPESVSVKLKSDVDYIFSLKKGQVMGVTFANLSYLKPIREFNTSILYQIVR